MRHPNGDAVADLISSLFPFNRRHQGLATSCPLYPRREQQVSNQSTSPKIGDGVDEVAYVKAGFLFPINRRHQRLVTVLELTIGCLPDMFPINRCHQRLATFARLAASIGLAFSSFQSIGVTKDWRLLASCPLIMTAFTGFQSICVTKNWRPTSQTAQEAQILKFPIKMRHQRLATLRLQGLLRRRAPEGICA